MKIRPMPGMTDNVVNVIPLIDVVMCMIIFFMLVARIGVASGVERIDIPRTHLGDRLENYSNIMTLNIRAAESGGIQVRVMVEGQWRELSVEDGTLRDLLSRMRARNELFEVIIRAERDLPFALLEGVLLACTQANVTRVHFNTQIAD